MAERDPIVHAFQALIDLASERVGGEALIANDEFFAPKENLLKSGRGVFILDKYTDRGKWMDGWETRRRRTPGNDWCVIKLGLPGIIRGVDIDTNHFLGNNPQFAALDTVNIDGEFPRDDRAVEQLSWKNILQRSPLDPGSQNPYEVRSDGRSTHVRLNIYPDGGVARLRIYGAVIPEWSKYKTGDLIDLVAVENGGVPLMCSDMFFSSMHNLIMPGRALNMGDGWETKRRRGPGYDWIILKLGAVGTVRKIEVDTNHFKGNYPDTCSLEACSAPDATTASLTDGSVSWKELLPKTRLQADTRHFFETELNAVGACSHLRLNIFPDGGVSRLRVWGTLT